MATAAVETMQEQSNSNGMINNAAISHKGGQENEVGAGLGTDKKWPGWPGDNVFRLVVPVQKVGGIIGPKGEFVKKMCEKTRSRIGRKGEFVKRPGHLSLEFYLLSAMMVDY